MDQQLDRLYEILQKQIGLHRQLLELIRAERTALEQADVKEIQDVSYSKEVTIHAIQQAEMERIRHLAALSAETKTNLTDLPLSRFVELVQKYNLKTADQFRSVQNTLKILIDRVQEQNTENRLFVEKSLEHIAVMKRNVLGEANPKNDTYTQKGKKSDLAASARILSKEA
jgi:flagellar biosynthesis/type III secretory pathway chaperone